MKRFFRDYGRTALLAGVLLGAFLFGLLYFMIWLVFDCPISERMAGIGADICLLAPFVPCFAVGFLLRRRAANLDRSLSHGDWAGFYLIVLFTSILFVLLVLFTFRYAIRALNHSFF